MIGIIELGAAVLLIALFLIVLPLIGEFYLCRYLWRSLRNDFVFTTESERFFFCFIPILFLLIILVHPLGFLFALPVSFSTALIIAYIWAGLKTPQNFRETERKIDDLSLQRSGMCREFYEVERFIQKKEKEVNKKSMKSNSEWKKLEGIDEEIKKWVFEDASTRKVWMEKIKTEDYHDDKTLTGANKRIFLLVREKKNLESASSEREEVEYLKKELVELKSKKQFLAVKIKELEDVINLEENKMSYMKQQKPILN